MLVGPARADSPLPSVSVDDAAGIRRAVNHLSALGHRVIGHVSGGEGHVHTDTRRTAWRNALIDAGLPEGPLVAADFTGAGGSAASHELLDLPEPPTAIVHANDLMAIAGIAAAVSRGLRVPDELSVVGFDDVPLAPYTAPALTTVRQSVPAWGRAAAQVLVAEVEGRSHTPDALPAVEFIVRAGTAPPRPSRTGQVSGT
ncbi:substrate-binding domain-containing protein [Streptomyces sp. NBC_01012]|nr:substrate-binding domain-containing protein [Streptomyces sp. NBC_01012]